MLRGKDEAGKKLEDPACEFRSGVWRYGVAIVTVALALGVRLALAPWLGNHAPYVLFMLAVAVTVWLAGLGPAIVAAVLSVPLALIFAMTEYYPWHTKIIGIVIYAAAVASIALLGRSMRMARAQAQAGERFRQAVLDAIPARIAVLNSAGIVIAVNERWKELKAGTDYMAICRKFVQDGEPSATHACSLLESLLQGRGGDFQVEYCCPDDGGPRWYLLQASRLPAAIGGAVMAHVDITQRKEAERALRESQERLALAASATNVGIFEWNLRTDEALWTPELDRLFGLPSTETAPAAVSCRLDWRQRIHPDDLAAVEAEFDNARAQRRLFECEHRIVWPDGSVHWVQTRGQFYYDNGQALRMLGTVFDVTTKKEAQRQLKQAADDLSQSNQDLEQFAHIASHDLKEPLGVMTMYLALLRKKHAPALDEEANQFIGHAVDAVGRMGRLINDLLAYSRVGRKTEGFTPTDMEDVL
ncbi:MAG: PAS domain-containing protein, partial [Planctomycetaceae bacterium]